MIALHTSPATGTFASQRSFATEGQAHSPATPLLMLRVASVRAAPAPVVKRRAAALSADRPLTTQDAERGNGEKGCGLCGLAGLIGVDWTATPHL